MYTPTNEELEEMDFEEFEDQFEYGNLAYSPETKQWTIFMLNEDRVWAGLDIYPTKKEVEMLINLFSKPE